MQTFEEWRDGPNRLDWDANSEWEVEKIIAYCAWNAAKAQQREETERYRKAYEILANACEEWRHEYGLAEIDDALTAAKGATGDK